MQDITGKVRVEIKQTRGNMRRMALYWDILSTAAPILSNMIEGDTIDENMLHKILKDRRGPYREVILPRDRKSVVQGKSVSVRVDIGGARILKKKKKSANK